MEGLREAIVQGRLEAWIRDFYERRRPDGPAVA
jgi:queuine/archaeosine tRNA-ribosyltransferase